MNDAPKRIKDIRYFERAEPDVFVSPMPGHLGKLYPEADRGELVAADSRYALKLAESGLHLPGFHHVYVTLNPTLGAGQVRVSDRSYEWWMRFVDVGVPLEHWPENIEAQRECVTRASTAALTPFLDETTVALVREVELEVLSQGVDLEILRLEKVGKTKSIRVTYQVLPFRQPAPVFVEVSDHRTGQSGKIEAFRVKCYDDVFPLIGSVSLSADTITLKPRASWRAELTTRDYKTPIEIPIARILKG